MNLGTLVREAFRNLLSNKVRSFLTMLGIFIGVGAVIAMMALGNGAKEMISNEMNALGTNTLYLSPGNFSENVRNPQPITNADVAALLTLDSIEVAAPVVSSSFTVSQSNGNTTNATVSGVIPEYLDLANYDIANGSFITQQQVDEKEMVAVIGSEIQSSLFSNSNSNVIGETVRINNQPYRIIGVTKEKGSSITGQSQDRNIYIPVTTAQTRLITARRNSVNQVSLRVADGYDTTQTKNEVETLMRERHDIFEGNPNDFTVMNIQELISAFDAIMNTYIIFLGGIAGISLLVGGIGIMNIMLVTVTERTREIGLRKALGAKHSDIQAQFLVESSVLSLVGGVFGIIFGYGLSTIIGIVANMFGVTINPSFDLFTIIGTTIFSIAVGLFFGIYPANRAAKLEPVIALRSE